MRSLYCFSLSKQTSRIMNNLKGIDMKYEVWSNNIDFYLDILLHDQPKYILGLGMYSGIGKENIRIETVTKNQFRNIQIEDNFSIKKQIVISPFVQQLPNTLITKALGNSWCNLVSYKIMRLIEGQKLKSKYTFLHIPKVFNRNNAIDIINQLTTI